MHFHKKFAFAQVSGDLNNLIDSAWDELRERMIYIAVNIWAKNNTEISQKYKEDRRKENSPAASWRPTEARTAWLVNYLNLAPEGSYDPKNFKIKISKNNLKDFISKAEKHQDIKPILETFISYSQYKNLLKRLVAQSKYSERYRIPISQEKLRCTYCNISLEWNRKTQSYLDRVGDLETKENSYSPQDLVLACSKCNKLKGSLSTMDFLNLIKDIYKNVWAESNEDQMVVKEKIDSNKKMLTEIFDFIEELQENIDETANAEGVDLPKSDPSPGLDNLPITTADKINKRIVKLAHILSNTSKSSNLKSSRKNKIYYILNSIHRTH